MIQTETIEDAPILIPNKGHRNFTKTEEYIPKGTKIKGDVKIISGKRRGEDFDYRMFATDNNKLIYLDKIKPMENQKDTEVTLGADGATQGAVVTIPQKSGFNLDAITIGTMIVAAGGTYWYAKHKKFKTHHALMMTGVALVAGYFGGQAIQQVTGKNKVVIAK